MYLAGAFILLICALTLVGTLISDILLALVDPRIRLRVTRHDRRSPSPPSTATADARRRLPVAADLVGVPPPPAGHGRPRRSRSLLYLVAALRRLPRRQRPVAAERARRLPPAAGAALLRHAAGRQLVAPAARPALRAEARPADAAPRSSPPDPTRKVSLAVLRRRATPTGCSGLFPIEHPSASRSVDPRQPLFLLGADRLGRCVCSRIMHGTQISLSIGLVGVFLSLTLGVAARRHLRLLSAGAIDFVIQRVDRVRAVAADHPALAGPRRGAAAGLAAAAHLFHDHADPVADRLDAARARGARPLPRAAHRGLRHRGAARRRVRGPHHLPPHAAVASPATSSPRSRSRSRR